MASAATSIPTKPVASDRVKAENRLGWRLAGPAVFVMLLVTAWPMLRALPVVVQLLDDRPGGA